MQYKGSAVLESMHKLLLEALRHREQEIVRYLVILGPTLGGFIWLIYSGSENTKAFIIGTVGVNFLLLLGTLYSLSLGYNYRHIVLELAKIEAVLGIKNAMLEGWPRSPADFLDRYRIFNHLPWCTPPEVIKVFWIAFLVGIIGVTVTACIYKPDITLFKIVIPSGVACLILGLFSPIWFGWKLHNKCRQEPKDWNTLR